MRAKQETKKGREEKKGMKKSRSKGSKSGWIGPLMRMVKEKIILPLTAERKIKATELLKEDHEKVKGLIKRLKSAEEDKMELLGLIEEEIKIHSRCEEKIFYPEMKKINGELIAESLEEHHQVDVTLAELTEMTGEEEEFEAKVTLLEENLHHHIEEEEGEMFPQAEKKLKDQLENLGAEIAYYKGELSAKGRRAA